MKIDKYIKNLVVNARGAHERTKAPVEDWELDRVAQMRVDELTKDGQDCRALFIMMGELMHKEPDAFNQASKCLEPLSQSGMKNDFRLLAERAIVNAVKAELGDTLCQKQ